MNWLVTLIVALLRVFLPALVKASKPASEEADRNIELRDRLRRRVRRTWPPLVLVVVCLLLSGCATRTIYIPDGTPVRLRMTVRDAKVWVLDKQGQPVPGRMDLPEGWYVLPDDGLVAQGGGDG
jgi:hypothetical protein